MLKLILGKIEYYKVQQKLPGFMKKKHLNYIVTPLLKFHVEVNLI